MPPKCPAGAGGWVPTCEPLVSHTVPPSPGEARLHLVHQYVLPTVTLESSTTLGMHAGCGWPRCRFKVPAQPCCFSQPLTGEVADATQHPRIKVKIKVGPFRSFPAGHVHHSLVGLVITPWLTSGFPPEHRPAGCSTDVRVHLRRRTHGRHGRSDLDDLDGTNALSCIERIPVPSTLTLIRPQPLLTGCQSCVLATRYAHRTCLQGALGAPLMKAECCTLPAGRPSHHG